MPVRSSLCTYSPSSMATTGSTASSKYSSILPTSSSLSYGQYKPLSSGHSSSFRSSPSAGSSTAGTSTLGRYNRLTTSHSPASSSSSASSSYSPSSYTQSHASSSSGVYKPYSPTSSFSSRYGPGGGHLSTSSSVSPGSRYSSSSSSTGSITSSSSSAGSDHGYQYKSPGSSTLSSSAYSSGGSLASSASSAYSSAGYTSPYTSRVSRRLSSSGISSSPSSPPLPPGVPCGLVNLGNTCYMNASLQSLYALESFRNLVLSRYQESTSRDKVLTHELSEVFKLLKNSSAHKEEENSSLSSSSSSNNNPISPANFKYAFSRYQTKFSGFGQQDAQEFLRYLINGIHEESNAASKRPRRTRPLQAPKTAQEAWSQYRDVVDDSPLVDLLVGQLCSTITCGECQNKSHCWDPFWDLSLPLMTRASGGSTYSWRHTTSQLSDVIDEFTSKEVLDSDERPVCSHCKKATKSTKQISLARLPRLMILHLKKFTNDGYKLTSGEIQINKQLTFNGTTYQLKACISHHGHSSSSGHYTAHCEYASRWFHFDDGRVRDITQTFDSHKLDDAYVLFYTQSRGASSGSLSQSKL